MARLVREGVAVRPARGLYQLAEALPDPCHTLAEVSALVSKGVICLTSALQFHELTLRMPSAVWIAVDRVSWKPKISYPPLRIVRFGGPALTEGVECHWIEGVDVPCSSPPRRSSTASATATRSASTSPLRDCAKGCGGGA